VKIGADLERDLTDILDKMNVRHKTDVFLTGERLLYELENGTHYDLIFLDIEFALSEIDGVEVGRRIRDVHHNHLTAIVYISWERKYALQLFDIQPFNFLVKPLRYEKTDEVLRKYIKIAGLWSETFTYKIGHAAHKARIKDIVYLESADRKLILHLAGGKREEFYGSLKAVYEEQLSRFDFLFIHNAFVINYDYVTALKFDHAILNGVTLPLPISKHRRNAVKEKYCEIMKRRT
jgi:DNA-binding LytR/AlgR family response regulator